MGGRDSGEGRRRRERGGGEGSEEKSGRRKKEVKEGKKNIFKGIYFNNPDRMTSFF